VTFDSNPSLSDYFTPPVTSAPEPIIFHPDFPAAVTPAGTTSMEILPPAAASGPGTPTDSILPSDARQATPDEKTPVPRQPCAPPFFETCAATTNILMDAGATIAAGSANQDASAHASSSLEPSEEFHAAPRLVMAATCSDKSAGLTSHSWIVDSGATVTIVSNLNLLKFVDHNIAPISIKTMTGAIVKSSAAGPCIIPVIDPRTRACKFIHIKLAYFVPGVAFNLFAVQDAQLHNLAVHFDTLVPGYYGSVRQGVDFVEVLCLIQKVGGALCLTCPACFTSPDPCPIACTSAVHTPPAPMFSPADLASLIKHRNSVGGKSVHWTLAQAHRNLGHRNSDDILRMSDAGLLPRIHLTTRRMDVCHACAVGNLNFHSAVPKQHHRATRPLERIYLDFFI
jgi:hypothetical protein